MSVVILHNHYGMKRNASAVRMISRWTKTKDCGCGCGGKGTCNHANDEVQVAKFHDGARVRWVEYPGAIDKTGKVIRSRLSQGRMEYLVAPKDDPDDRGWVSEGRLSYA